MLSNVTMDVNNCTNSTNISLSVEEYLQHLQDKTNITMIPATIFMSILACCGLVGNVLVLLVYSHKMKLNPTKVLLMTIASFDLVANLGAIPSEINVMFHSWNFKNPGVCKSKVFLGSFTTIGGALSLVIVAVIRYRKVCRPYGWQISIRHSKIASSITVIVGFLYSIPYMVIYGIKTRDTPCTKIKGYECFADDNYHDTIWPLINNLLFILFFICTAVSLVVLYILIGVTAWKHSQRHGVSGTNVYTKHDDSSSTAMSSTDRELSASNDLAHAQLGSAAPVIPGQASLTHSLLCCMQRSAANESETQSSNITKITITTTDNDTSDNNLELTSREINVNTCSKSSLNLQVPLNSSLAKLPGPAFVCTKGIEMTGDLVINSESEVGNRGRHDNRLAENTSTRTATTYKTKTSKTAKNDTRSRQKTEEKHLKRKPLGRMTVMLIIISAIYIFGFFPFLILTIYKNRLPKQYLTLSTVEFSFYNFFYRLYFLNSAANPVIYSLCDINFRRECIRLLTCRSRR